MSVAVCTAFGATMTKYLHTLAYRLSVSIERRCKKRLRCGMLE